MMFRSVAAVLLDVGGVLLLPGASATTSALRGAGIDPRRVDRVRAHYRAIAALDATDSVDATDGSFDPGVYRRAYLRACGVPPESMPLADEEMARTFTSESWSARVPGAAAALRRFAARGIPVGILSNSTGVIARVLASRGLCQVGAGPHAEVRVIVDSGVVGVRKPGSEIFRVALDHLDVDPGEVVHVGDSARFDIDGAHNAGVLPVHFDPYADCPDPAGHHAHARRLDLLPEILAA